MPDTKDCAKYFKERSSYHRIMKELRRIYQKYGELKGNVIFGDASDDECRAADAIVNPKRAFMPPVLKFGAVDFEKGLRKTVFRDVNLKEVVECYFGECIVTNKEQKVSKTQNITAFFNQITAEFENSPCKKWLVAMAEQKKFGYRTIIKEYNVSCENALIIIKNVCTAIDERCDSNDPEPIQLAVLSALVTGDSHYFDTSYPAGRLLIYGLSYIAEIADANGAENIKRVYAAFGIEPDNISCAAAAVGVRLYYSDKTEHPAFKIFADNSEICLISAAGLLEIKYAKTDSGVVFIVENQMVFSALYSIAAEHGLCLLCTSGQLKIAGIKLIGMLVEAGCEIYYAGDFDPEGLQIADKLLKRYPRRNVHTWRMNVEDYESIEKGDNISARRLKKLKTIESDELIAVSRAIEHSGKAAYQELLISAMKKDMIAIGERKYMSITR